MSLVRCLDCSSENLTDDLSPTCAKCGGAVLLAERAPEEVTGAKLDNLPAGVWRFGALLHRVESESLVTLGEGGSPLLHSERLGPKLGLKNLLIKDESRNPTGSFVDRGSTFLLTMAREKRVRECTCVTTGNLGASLAAYCAKAGIRARIRISPNVDRGKLYQMLAYGADIEMLSSSRRISGRETGVLGVSATNPYLLEGEKTTGFEIAQELGWKLPDVIAVPVGTGGHISMIWQSLNQLRDWGLVRSTGCRLLGVRLEGSADYSGRRKSKSTPEQSDFAELEESEPSFRKEASRAVSQSKGTTLTTTAKGTIEATGILARLEGIFAEPSSASVVSALGDAVREGRIDRSETVVCIITGAGLKDPKTISHIASRTNRLTLAEPHLLPTPKIGDTKLALLRLLQTSPSYGYELWQHIRSEKSVSTASIYQHLTELESYALIRRGGAVVIGGRERIPYELTRRGDDFLKIAGKLEHAERTSLSTGATPASR